MMQVDYLLMVLGPAGSPQRIAFPALYGDFRRPFLRERDGIPEEAKEEIWKKN
jgi:hypothetical protein